MFPSLHAASPQTDEGNAENVDPHKVDVGDAITCRLDAPTLNGFALSVADDPMIDAIVAAGKATRAQVEADIKFRKFLGERVISEVTEPVTARSWHAHVVIARNVSNVTPHPGKTLYGCSYKIELLDKEGKPL